MVRVERTADKIPLCGQVDGSKECDQQSTKTGKEINRLIRFIQNSLGKNKKISGIFTSRGYACVFICNVPECGRDPGVAGVARENLADRTCGSKDNKQGGKTISKNTTKVE